MAQSFYDGDWNTPSPDGAVVISLPLQNKGDTRARMVTQAMKVKAAKYRSPVLGSQFPQDFSPDLPRKSSLKLTAHLSPALEGPILYYESQWCDVPEDRIDVEIFVYVYQFIRSFTFGSVTLTKMGEVTKTVSSLVRVRYVHTANPAEIEVKRAQKYIRSNSGRILSVGNTYESVIRGYRLAEDTSFDRWNGNIWEVRERYVKSLETATEALL